MTQYLITDDVEALLVPLLAAAFPEAAIYRTAPAVLPSKPIITVRRTGGVERSRYVDQAHVDIHVYAGDDITATSLALRVQAFLNAHAGGPILITTASGPADLGGSPPRRFLYCDVLMRRKVREEAAL